MTDPQKSSRDLLSLTKAPIAELIEALKQERTEATLADGDEGGGASLPPRSLQIAELLAAETVRLIRLGTRAELTEARLDLARAVASKETAELGDEQPKVRRLLTGSAVALSFATAPSSAAGELAVLRSWNGMAAEVVALVDQAPEKYLRRAELRELLDIDESHLSHLLADLESANLIARRRSGREVTVHLGRTGRSRHVAEFIGGVGSGADVSDADRPQPEAIVREAFSRLIEESKSNHLLAEPSDPVLRPLLDEAAELHRDGELIGHEVVAVEDGWITCRVNTWVTHREDEWNESIDDRYVFWAAKVENGEIVEAKSLAPTGRMFKAVTPGRGLSNELPRAVSSDETALPVEIMTMAYRDSTPTFFYKDIVKKGSFRYPGTTLDYRNDVNGPEGTHSPAADLSPLTVAVERVALVER